MIANLSGKKTSPNQGAARLLPVPSLIVLALALAAAAGVTACSHAPQDSQQLRQQTADATRDVKQGAKDLAQDTKTAAASAVNGVNAAAQGMHDGLGADSTHPLNINQASQARIALLPGISLANAGSIVKGRPYHATHQLVSRHILTSDQYSKIADRITTH